MSNVLGISVSLSLLVICLVVCAPVFEELLFLGSMPLAHPPYNILMGNRPFNLAIETSGRVGSITLGRADEPIDTAELPRRRRHHIELIPTIDLICRAHRVAPHDLGELYVSVGPGSFTGLRVAIAIVKMIALGTGARVVAVPTLEVLAQGAHPADSQIAHVAVCLNLKDNQVYSAVYVRDGRTPVPVAEPALRTFNQLLTVAPRPLLIVADPLPDALDMPRDGSSAVVPLPTEFAVARSDQVWHLGRAKAARSQYDDPQQMIPLYARPPEAVELWKRRHHAPQGRHHRPT